MRRSASTGEAPGSSPRWPPAKHGAEGIGRRISEAAIAREPVRPLYLYAEAHNVGRWCRFAFEEIDGGEIPPDLRMKIRLIRLLLRVYNPLTRHRYRIVVMRRAEP